MVECNDGGNNGEMMKRREISERTHRTARTRRTKACVAAGENEMKAINRCNRGYQAEIVEEYSVKKRQENQKRKSAIIGEISKMKIEVAKIGMRRAICS